MKKVSFNVDKQKLHGTLFYPEKPKHKNPAVLFLHGWMSSENNYLPLAQFLSRLGFIVLTINLRGHGTSEGDIKKLSREDFLHDCIASYEYLANINSVDTSNISISGSSFGSYMAILLTEKKEVANLALRVPANYPDNDFDKPQFEFSSSVDKGIYQRFQHLFQEETRAQKVLHNFNGNVLLIESEKDAIVPHEMVMGFANAIEDKSKLTHTVMKNTPHQLGEEDRKRFFTILIDWFRAKV